MTKSTISSQKMKTRRRYCQLNKNFKREDLKKVRQPFKNKKTCVKWRFLEHRGPVFPPSYKMLPSGVCLKYDGKPVRLGPVAEEVMTYYAKLLGKKYARKKSFIKNFFADWRKVMSTAEQKRITNFHLCDFRDVCKYYQMLHKQRNRSRDPKKKNRQCKIERAHGYCNWDGRIEKINRFRIEPPGLFKGRGNHPKMGKLKHRVMPEDVVINCSANSFVPSPPSGHKWKQVQHKNQVAWLASWVDNVSGLQKYIMPDSSSAVMTRSDVQKFETARKLKRFVKCIRRRYTADMRSTDQTKRQLAVALYFIDRLSLRAGNEKEDSKSADTVGCCSLRCEHVRLNRKLKKNFVVTFDFLGKDSIRYYKKVQVPKQVYRNLLAFKERKRNTDQLFNRLNTVLLNKYLDFYMEGLTAKVFRTYNASITLQRLLKKLRNSRCKDEESKIMVYNQANRAVAILCNHQRAPPRNYNQQVMRIKQRMKTKLNEIASCRQETKKAKTLFQEKKSCTHKKVWKSKKQKLERLEKQLSKLQLLATEKMENKKVALVTSKTNYIDPRITVAW